MDENSTAASVVNCALEIHKELGSGLLESVYEVLLADALRRAHGASKIVPMQLLVVHAKDESAAAFYAKHGLRPFPKTPLHLFLPIASIDDARMD